MDTIVLAGGFAQRLYPTTEEIPKPLLTVAGIPALTYLVDELNNYYDGGNNLNNGKCYLTVNQKYAPDFANFMDRQNACFSYELVVEESTNDNEKPGPNRAIKNVLDNYPVEIARGVMVIAGDSVSSLSLTEFADFYKEEPSRSVAALYDIVDKMKASGKYGVADINSENRITNFEEKPDNPLTSLVNTTYFALCKRDLMFMDDIISMSGPSGDYIDSLVKKGIHVAGYVFDGYWFDIGDHGSLAEANRFMRKLSVEESVLV